MPFIRFVRPAVEPDEHRGTARETRYALDQVVEKTADRCEFFRNRGDAVAAPPPNKPAAVEPTPAKPVEETPSEATPGSGAEPSATSDTAESPEGGTPAKVEALAPAPAPASQPLPPAKAGQQTKPQQGGGKHHQRSHGR